MKEDLGQLEIKIPLLIAQIKANPLGDNAGLKDRLTEYNRRYKSLTGKNYVIPEQRRAP